MKTVLLTNAQQRKTLATARSLGRRGIKIIASEDTRLNPTAFSKYCDKMLVYPSPKKTPKAFFDWLQETIIRYKCDILYPMDDDTLDVVMQYYDELSKLCEIPIPSANSYQIACDKGSSVVLATNNGVECPRSILVENLEEIPGISARISYPAVIKPRKSSGSRGINVVNSPDELISKYSCIHKDHPYPIIQEYIGSGDRYDVCLLFDRAHRLKATFVQKEIRHFPIPMGPSTLQESIILPELIKTALKMVKSLDWSGVIELEFMLDSRDGKLKFMEINPRFWASVQTAIVSGIDFPWLLYRTITEEDIEEQFDYQPGVKCRWMLPGDIFHFLTNKERKQMNPSFWSGRKQGIYDDILSKEDPLPLLGFVLACFKYMFVLQMWRFMFKR